MKGLSTACIGLSLALVAITFGFVLPDSPAAKITAVKGLASIPLAFTENQGQWDARVLFRASSGGVTMWFTHEGTYFQFTRRGSKTDAYGSYPLGLGGEHPADQFARGLDRIETMLVKVTFAGANARLRVVAEDLLEYKCNFFFGNDPAKWQTDVANYQVVVYEDVYPGIDLKYYGNGKQMEYDFVVSPGADFTQIRIQYEGVKSLSVDTAGRLVVETEWGTVTELKPFVYQPGGDARSLIQGEYTILSEKTIGFKLGEGYNPNLVLVIDPILSHSTYLGGSDRDTGEGIAVDGDGNTFVTGTTWSSDFPTENSYQTDQGNVDVFVTKLNSSGDGLVYSTYLGGSDFEHSGGIAVDGEGNAYVSGGITSLDFPTKDPFQLEHGGGDYDAFVVKLSSSGDSLMYSTYLGGTGYDVGRGIAVDGSGGAYVIGSTASSDFPTENPYKGTLSGSSDVFVTKLEAAGNVLHYSTYLGGLGSEEGRGIAVDGLGCVYLTGKTSSSDFPTANAFDGSLGGSQDAFVAKLSAVGNTLEYSTFLGGAGDETGYGMAVDGTGKAHVVGFTASSDFPVENAYNGSYNGSDDAFITSFSADGSVLVYSTFLGGTEADVAYSIAVDSLSCAYVTGKTNSPGFPTQNAYDPTFNGGTWDAFVTVLSADASSLVYSTFLGGTATDVAYGVAVDNSRCAYITGKANSYDFPTRNGYDSTFNGGYDAFEVKISPCCANTGDVDHSGAVNVVDLTYLIDYLFLDGPPPPCPEEGDVNTSGVINVADLTYLVDYLFFDGPAPPGCP